MPLPSLLAMPTPICHGVLRCRAADYAEMPITPGAFAAVADADTPPIALPLSSFSLLIITLTLPLIRQAASAAIA